MKFKGSATISHDPAGECGLRLETLASQTCVVNASGVIVHKAGSWLKAMEWVVAVPYRAMAMGS